MKDLWQTVNKSFKSPKRIKPKYGNRKTILYGITFDSKLEAEFYLYLRSKFDKDDILLQPGFILQEKFRDESGKAIRAIKYKADFYVRPLEMYIDCKGYSNAIFKLKVKMLYQKYPNINFMYGSNKVLMRGIEDHLALSRILNIGKGEL